MTKRARVLIGKRSRKTYQLAQMLDVRLLEARPVTGGLLFGPAEGSPGAYRPGPPSCPEILPEA